MLYFAPILELTLRYGEFAAKQYRQELSRARKDIADRLASALIREGLAELDLPMLRVTATGRLVIDHDRLPARHIGDDPVALWDHMVRLGKGPAHPAFRAELAESATHLALSRVSTTLCALSDRAVIDWRSHRQHDRTFSQLAFIEQCVTDGHPLHPGARIRGGMSFADVFTYAPEWTDQIRLPLVAIHRDHLADHGLHALLHYEQPELMATATEALRQAGAQADYYISIPAHPWQLKNVLPQQFAHAFSRRVIIPLAVNIPARPLLSVRTLAPVAGYLNHPSHLKTAVGVRLTGAVRGVSSFAAHDGPRISQLLAKILRLERNFAGRLAVCAETASAHYLALEPAPDTGASAALGVIARRNPEADLDRDEIIVPVAALRAQLPGSDASLLTELLDQLHSGNRASAAFRFARQYAEVVIPPLLVLLTRYGVALEAHGQNSLLVFGCQQGLPRRLVIRDFGAIRINPTRLARKWLNVALAPGSPVQTDCLDDLRNRLFYALIHDHLGEFIPALAAHRFGNELELWGLFAAAATRTFDLLRMDCPAEAIADEKALFAPTAPLKRLLTMRLFDQSHEASYIAAPNPLAVATGVSRRQ